MGDFTGGNVVFELGDVIRLAAVWFSSGLGPC